MGDEEGTGKQPKTGETFLVNGKSFAFFSIGFKPDELYVVTEDEAKSHVNHPVAKAPSDVMGQSPDDLVTQDHMPIRVGVDEFRYQTMQWRLANADDNFRGYEQHGWVHPDTGDTLEVRCRRKDLPVGSDRIPIILYWYDGNIVGRYADVLIHDQSFIPIHSDGNGGWFIKWSTNAGN